MYLPDELATRIKQDGGGPLRITARALYDLDGQLGETFLAADDRTLWLFSRRTGGEFQARRLARADITELNVAGQTVFAELALASAAGRFTLTFTAWDKPQLDALAAWWSAGRPPPPPPSAPVIALSPLEAFCAAIHALIGCDDHVDVAELGFLARQVGDPQAIERGQATLKQHGLDALLERLPAILNAEQRRCLLANLIGVAMLDGLLREAELNLIERFQAALDIGAADRRAMFDVLLTQHRLAVLAEPGPEPSPADGLTPLIAFCAAMRALTAADTTLAHEEREHLESAVGDERTIRMGENYLQAHGREHLLQRLGTVLNADQKACLLANLIAVALADGQLKRGEQDLLERFRRALGVSDKDHASWHEVLLLKNRAGLFTAAA